MYTLAAVLLVWATSCGDEAPPTAPPTPNRPPAAQGTIPAQVTRPGRSTTLDVSTYFSDPDGQPLTFASTSSDATVASVSVSGSTVTVLGEWPGTADVTVTARDPAGLAGVQAFEVTVEPLSDREILVLFHQTTGGPNWYGSENWNTDAPLEDWQGVDVDDDGRVVRLVLYRNNVAGRIPIELAGLARLAHLELPSNHLTGSIPPQLGQLADLSFLDLFNNRLEGLVPSELGNLSALTQLEIDLNPLTGPIPDSFLGLGRLSHFYFSRTDGLCVPATSEFITWIEETTYLYEGPFCNQSGLEALASLYETAGGADWTRADGWLEDAAAGHWHGVTVDSIGRITRLDLSGNGLTGRVPQNLGRLERLTELRLDDNALSGRLPESLSALSLSEFRYDGTDLCVPAGASFRTWLDEIWAHQGTGTECAPPSDRDILAAFHDAAGGPDWTEDENWLTDAELDTWHGVETNGEGRVTTLRLNSNGLSGPIAPELGQLSELRELTLWNNGLSGPIPPELGDLSRLTELILSYNDLSGPIPEELAQLTELAGLHLAGSNLAGAIPPGLATLPQLGRLVLSDNDLTGPIPPQFGDFAQLESLWLGDNGLTGAIPPELGRLSSLRELALQGNALTGSIPPQLGNLVELRNLVLADNGLTGAIPGELFNLSELRRLDLSGNGLSGSIPPRLEGLPDLWALDLSNNDLTGSIPATPANSDISTLRLSSNRLTGSIPARLGDLPRLTGLFLDNNRLTGSVPPGLGRAPRLRRLVLTNNPAMSGAFPDSLKLLDLLNTLVTAGTDLCAPPDTAFLPWLEGIPKRQVSLCEDGGRSTAYLTQAVQSPEHPVPLVAGEPALLRVFVTAPQTTTEGIPPVRATFHVDDVETHVVDIPGKSTPIPTEVNEGDLEVSANIEIPGEVVQPGLEMVIEIDPGGTLDPALGVAARIPETGRAAVDVRAMPRFALTMIPFLLEPAPDSSILDLVGGMAEDPEGHPELADSRTLLPIGELDVTAHEPVLTSTNNASAMFRETAAIRAMENGTGYYMGVIAGRTEYARGLGQVPGPISFSVPESVIIAHELGHNLNLSHAPCGGAAGSDLSFPGPDGSIGAWGYDFPSGQLVRPGTRDLMSYCDPPWISSYYFTNMVRHRLSEYAVQGATATNGPTDAILLWGGVNTDGEPYLEPAFVTHAGPSLPPSGSEYQIVGRDPDGQVLFSIRFDMPEVPDGDGSSSFAFAHPVQPAWAGNLAGITLSGPGGSDTLDRETVRPMAILRNPRTGQVRGILRDPAPATRAARDAVAHAVEPGVEVLFSRGIPGADAWRR